MTDTRALDEARNLLPLPQSGGGLGRGPAPTKMFDLDSGKLIVIGIVALIAIPSKDLPRVMRAVGQMMGKMRRMSAEFQGQFMEAMREMEAADLKKEIEATNKAIMNSVKLEGAFDPLSEARKQITSAIEGTPPRRAPHAVAEPNDADDADESALRQSPHPEEARSAVSKDAPGGADHDASFETPASLAPQDEDGGSSEGADDKKASS